MRFRIFVTPLVLAFLLTLSTVPAAAHAPGVRVAGTPSIFVRVVNAETGEPVDSAGVLVAFLEGDPDHPIIVGSVTKSGGHAFFIGLQPGTYLIAVRAANFVPLGNLGGAGRPPTGQRVVLAPLSDAPVHVVVALVPLCATCRAVT